MNPPKDRKLRAIVLLTGEILFIATSPLWTEGETTLAIAGTYLWLFYAVFFFAGGYVLANSRRWLIGYIPVAAGAVAFGAFQNNTPLLSIPHYLFVCAVHVMLFRAVLRHSFLNHDVPHLDRLLAGIAGYLLLGLFWTAVLELFRHVGVASVVNQLTGEPVGAAERLYFSFVTLTTLGYGDIAPATPVARMLAVFTSLSGCLYLAVFVSALVGGLTRSDRSG